MYIYFDRTDISRSPLSTDEFKSHPDLRQGFFFIVANNFLVFRLYTKC